MDYGRTEKGLEWFVLDKGARERGKGFHHLIVVVDSRCLGLTTVMEVTKKK